MPTVANDIDIVSVAKACGYQNAVCVNSLEELDNALRVARDKKELSLIEVKCSIGARADLGRPTTTPKENKDYFMEALSE